MVTKVNQNGSEVVIIGGGPIGCWTALQVKRRLPHAQITIYERKPVYERDHVLTISRDSFFQWSTGGAEDNAFLQQIFAAQATCSIASGFGTGNAPPPVDLSGAGHNRLSAWRRLPKVLDIRTIDFERILKASCTQLGVNFVYRRVETPQEVMGQHPGCTTFIAADGAHSKMRTALLGPDALWTRDIYPSLDFNYVSHGQARYLRVNTYDKLGHVYAENIGLEQNGRSAINLRLIVSRDEYDALPDATFKAPLIVTPDSPFWQACGPSRTYGRTLKQDFYDLMQLRAQHANERPTDDPIRLTKVYLSQYVARRFATEVQQDGQTRSWFLVGDAAMGMPFYRSINSGLILGAQLAYLLGTPLVGEQSKVAVYNNFTQPWRIAREFARIGKTEARIMFYKNLARPAMHKLAQTPLAPLVRIPADYALKKLKLGKTS
jgi:2-polyprenyl-6-methoxyphenol hydroxylase-like FAD-dependent oxidoreductase